MADSSTKQLCTTCPSIEDPFQQIASEPWQQLDIGEGEQADGALPVPEIASESAQSMDNEDDTVVASHDPAACDFLLAAIIFQEQQSMKKETSPERDVLQEQLAAIAVSEASSSENNSPTTNDSEPKTVAAPALEAKQCSAGAAAAPWQGNTSSCKAAGLQTQTNTAGQQQRVS